MRDNKQTRSCYHIVDKVVSSHTNKLPVFTKYCKLKNSCSSTKHQNADIDLDFNTIMMTVVDTDFELSFVYLYQLLSRR